VQKHTILFLAANPSDTDRLALDREARAIHAELERSGHRECFEFVTRWATHPLDLLRELRKLRPTVVHFSGHGGHGVSGSFPQDGAPRRDIAGGVGHESDKPRQGLFFQGSDGQAQFVSAAALEETFVAAGASVKLVVLNACHSAVQAAALVAHVNCVVGMGGSIRDDAARNFAIGFYGGLGECESVAAAYKQGRAAISLEGAHDGDRPFLYHRHDVDPETFILTDSVPSIAHLANYDKSAIQKLVAQYTLTLKKDPQDRDALLALGVCYLKLGLFDLSDRFIRQMIDAHPADPSGYYYRAICVLKGKRPRTASLPVIREAEQLIGTALELDPSNGCYDALLAAVRHDYYVLNGMRAPVPVPEELIARAGAKHVDVLEVEQIFTLMKVNEGPVRRWFMS
jgi:hypothetical protein